MGKSLGLDEKKHGGTRTSLPSAGVGQYPSATNSSRAVRSREVAGGAGWSCALVPVGASQGPGRTTALTFYMCVTLDAEERWATVTSGQA